MIIAATCRVPCSSGIPTCGWRRSGAPSMRSCSQRAASDEKRKDEAERREQGSVVSQAAVVQ